MDSTWCLNGFCLHDFQHICTISIFLVSLASEMIQIILLKRPLYLVHCWVQAVSRTVTQESLSTFGGNLRGKTSSGTDYILMEYHRYAWDLYVANIHRARPYSKFLYLILTPGKASKELHTKIMNTLHRVLWLEWLYQSSREKPRMAENTTGKCDLSPAKLWMMI